MVHSPGSAVFSGEVRTTKPDTEQLILEGMSKEQSLRTRVTEIIGGEPSRLYKSLNLSYTLRDALFIYLLLLIAVWVSCALVVYLGPMSILLSPAVALLTGVAFNWINVQIHEASHGLLMRDRKWNSIYCNLVLGSWALQDVETYRATHNMHHANLHTPKDPDLFIYTEHLGSA